MSFLLTFPCRSTPSTLADLRPRAYREIPAGYDHDPEQIRARWPEIAAAVECIGAPGLKARGWTEAMIRDLLGEPDLLTDNALQDRRAEKAVAPAEGPSALTPAGDLIS